MTRFDILSPHYDDAALGAWHQIEVPGSRVVTVFGGAPDQEVSGLWDRFSSAKNGTETVALRQGENEAALAHTAAVGISLDFVDRQYQPFRSRNITEIADVVEETAVDDTHFLAPVGVGSLLRMHPDHVDTRRVGVELLRRGRDVSFYADIPYLLPVRDLSNWPERLPVRKIEKAIGRPVRIVPHELDPEMQNRKREALNEFITQMPMVNKLGFGALTSTDAYRWEATIHPK